MGELGLELYVPAEFAVGVFEDLMSAGAGIRCGTRWLLCDRIALRLEKGCRAFGRRRDPGENPVEAGLLFACKLGTDIGSSGAMPSNRRAPGVRRRLVGFAVSSPEPMLWGGELILRDGAPCGQVTSAAWGRNHRRLCGSGVCARACGESPRTGSAWATYDVNVGGRQYPDRGIAAAPLRSSANARIRS